MSFPTLKFLTFPFLSIMAVTHIHYVQPSICVVIKPFQKKRFSNGKVLFGSRIQTYHNAVPTLTRGLSVSRLWDALTSGNSAVMAIRQGMLLFRQGDVLGSLVEFDKAIQLDPRQKAYLWQRGCLYIILIVRYEEGAHQFRLDVAQNPNDTEESIWCFLCEAQLYGIHEARKRYLEVGRDPRPVMREAYNMFKDGGDPEKLVAAFLSGQTNEYFYASLYAGLYYESQNEPDVAKVNLIAACQSPYGSRSDDYMAALAKVHCKCRNWNIN